MSDGETRRKVDDLRKALSQHSRVVVAFSGGLDSSYLLATCLDVLGRERVTAATAASPLMPEEELEEARQLAAQLGARHVVMPLDELVIPEVAHNVPRRCYYCKRARFEALTELAGRQEGAALLHGENADDALDYRSGVQAARELGVRAPLAEVGLAKREIRALARERGLPNWDRPASPCLATRFPHNTPLTREGLERVARAEALLRDLLGTRALRVRDHHPVARIEAPPDLLASLAQEEMRAIVVRGLRECGYRYVALDLEGYRIGSMNEPTGQSKNAS